MAQITVERSAIADFLDELPGLLMQYKQMQWAQEERALERGIREKAIELEASKSLYNENQKLYYNAINNLDKLEATYGETVGSLEPLNEMYTSGGKDVTADIYEGEAKDYQARADNALENWQAVKNKIGILQGSLYGDVKRVKNIMAGGQGFEGGVDPEGWDLADLGIVAYEHRFGESSPTVVSMFENNPGLMTTSLASLQKTEGALALTGSKRKYYSGATETKTGDDEMKQAELVFGTIASSARKTSGKQMYDGLLAAKSILNQDPSNNVDEIDANNARQFEITKEIGKEFADLTGQVVTPEEYLDVTEEYFEMLNLAKGSSETRQGQTAYANWSVYKNYITQARDEYVKALQAGDAEKAGRLNSLAEKYFGKPQGIELSTFALDMDNYYSKTILASFSEVFDTEPADSSNINLDSLNVNLNEIEQLNDAEWEDLLGE